MKRPYIIINCAASVDGKLALPSRKQTRLSCKEDKIRVLKLRKSCDAVLVGIGTVLSDDPHLTVKGEEKQPVRVVLDGRGRVPSNAKVVNRSARTILFVRKGVGKKIYGENVDVIEEDVNDKGLLDLQKVLEKLHNMGIRRLLVEGGGTIIWSFLKNGLFDEFWIYISPVVIGGKHSPTIANGEGVRNEKEMIRLKLSEVKELGEGLLVKYVPR